MSQGKNVRLENADRRAGTLLPVWENNVYPDFISGDPKAGIPGQWR